MLRYSIIAVPDETHGHVYYHFRRVEGFGSVYGNPTSLILSPENIKKAKTRISDFMRLERRGDIKVEGFHLGIETLG